ncbi:frataxin homolog, mitochondrial [Diorhabda sublineata]|uniref:frataxin homolog, mitochondrial n=1 Tax=Diorhabda sublineata TaxID=1163346 RepID=UPI0024E15965|nr:frataxin homolog, mitochondrial [Diorhabda sublineata]
MKGSCSGLLEEEKWLFIDENIAMLRLFKLIRPRRLKCNYQRRLYFPNCTKLNITREHYLASKNTAYSHYSTFTYKQIDDITFEKVCEETLEDLTDFFEELVESNEKFQSADVSFSSGILTINLGQYGTYVINRQSPNKQIWLSSPKSGPKRYDFVPEGKYWLYKHDMKTLHELLQNEFSTILGEKVDMSNCCYYKSN